MPLKTKREAPYYERSSNVLITIREYAAILNQYGTSEPETPTVLYDTIGIEVGAYTRLSTGIYNLYFPDVPNSSYATISNSAIDSTEIKSIYIFRVSDDDYMIRTYNNGSLSDDVLLNSTIYIKQFIQ